MEMRMKTFCEGVEIENTASIKFKFRIGGKTYVQERELNMPEMMKDPEEYGDVLRTAWRQAQQLAVLTHKEGT